ncbi:MAG: RhuM family protein [Patescibacteria group bacterium]
MPEKFSFSKIKKNTIVIYKTPKGPELEVRLEKETIWLTQAQIARLFGTQRPAITKHLNNIFKTGELKENSVCSILEHTAADKKIYETKFYNLDAIISIGYRVNSKQATQFRIWGTNTLKNYLVNGYTVNEKRLLSAQGKFKELQSVISFLQEKSKHKLLTGQEREIFDLLANYSKTLTLLEQYDKEKLVVLKNKKSKFVLEYKEANKIITALKNNLINKKEAGGLFGQEYKGRLQGIIGGIYQTFGGKELYSSLEEKAAHLLYFIIKDHPFADGNKRTASFLFVYFLDKNNFLYRNTGEKKINDNALTALTLLIAISDPKDKETMIKIITNLLQ